MVLRDVAAPCPQDASSRAYVWLRERIVSCRLLPGSRLSENEVAAMLGTSRTPVHEAVTRLQGEQLVEVRPRSGTFVARIAPPMLEEALLVRVALEQMVAEKAAERATPVAIAALRAALARQADCAQRRDRDGARQAADAFHAALAEAAGLPGAWRLAHQAKAHTDRYRTLADEKGAHGAAALVEHGDLVRAIEARNPARAVQAMRIHLRHIAPVLEIARALRPEYFRSG